MRTINQKNRNNINFNTTFTKNNNRTIKNDITEKVIKAVIPEK